MIHNIKILRQAISFFLIYVVIFLFLVVNMPNYTNANNMFGSISSFKSKLASILFSDNTDNSKKFLDFDNEKYLNDGFYFYRINKYNSYNTLFEHEC